MSREILIINGSARENGNTDNLLIHLVNGVKEAGNKSYQVVLREKKIGNCIGCYTCRSEGRCFIEDDFTDIRKVMEKSHKVVLASPLYFTGVTGLMKTFFDRLFFYYHENNKNLIMEKKAFVITTMNQTDVEREAYLVKKYYKIMLKSIGMEIERMLFFTDLMEKDAHKKYPAYHEELYRLGLYL